MSQHEVGSMPEHQEAGSPNDGKTIKDPKSRFNTLEPEVPVEELDSAEAPKLHLTIHENGEIVQNQVIKKKVYQLHPQNNLSEDSDQIPPTDTPFKPFENCIDFERLKSIAVSKDDAVSEKDVYTTDVIQMSNYTLLLLENWQLLYQLTLRRLIKIMYGNAT